MGESGWLSPAGRIGRRRWWLGYVLPCIGGSALIGFVAGLAAALWGGPPVKRPMLVDMIPVATGILFFWPLMAGSIKRLHDRDRSGGWVVLQALLTAFLFVLAWQVQSQGRLMDTAVALTLLAASLGVVVLGLWLFIEIYLLRGTQGPNRFGPDPLGAGGQPAWQQQNGPPIWPPVGGWPPPGGAGGAWKGPGGRR